MTPSNTDILRLLYIIVGNQITMLTVAKRNGDLTGDLLENAESDMDSLIEFVADMRKKGVKVKKDAKIS